jgi:hypothetical protein
MRGSKTMPFTRVRSSVTPAAGVNSPADSVVGIASCGSGAASSRTARSATTFAVSITLPPPNATMASASATRAASVAWATEFAGTCCRQRANVPAWSGPRLASSCASAGEPSSRLRVLSTNARRTPRRRSSSGTCASAPAPESTRSGTR